MSMLLFTKIAYYICAQCTNRLENFQKTKIINKKVMPFGGVPNGMTKSNEEICKLPLLNGNQVIVQIYYSTVLYKTQYTKYTIL